VQFGTRFLVSAESPVHAATKQAMVSANVGDTVLVGRLHGMNRRMLRNDASEKIRECEVGASLGDMLAYLDGRRSYEGLIEGAADTGLAACGQGIGVIREILSAAEIIDTAMKEARAALADGLAALERGTRPADQVEMSTAVPASNETARRGDAGR
jgi:enoyl-[acyl-carrier protein] reductase II